LTVAVSQSSQRFRLLTVAGGHDRVGVENQEEELAGAFRNTALSSARRTSARLSAIIALGEGVVGTVAPLSAVVERRAGLWMRC
jgi:hypothetical protein